MQDDLTALRKAARERNPDQTQFLLKRIFMNLSFYRALAVAVERAYRHVETFERYHPGAKWARQVLVQITTLGMAPGELPPQALREDYATPGTANFVKALFDLAHATRQNNPVETRIGYLVSAVVNAIMAELVEAWYGPRLDDWERVRQNRIDPATGLYSDSQVNQIAYRFWTDEEVARRDTAAWLEVADAVEAVLRR